MGEADPRDVGDATGITRSKRETRAAFENRAVVYRYIFDELVEELGEERAAGIMRRAIRRRGVAHGREKYADAARSRDFGTIARLFCESSAADGELFTPAVAEAGADGAVLTMASCPLVDAWRALGLDEAAVDLMCDIAAEVDRGAFEGVGLEIDIEERLGEPGATHCVLRLRAP